MNRLQMYLEQVRASGGLGSTLEARRAAAAVLRALVARLPSGEGEAVRALLAEVVALEDEDAQAGPSAAVATALGIDHERAGTASQAVIVATLEALGPGAWAVLAALPEQLRPAPAPVEHVPSAPRAPVPADHSLAGGRPGSRHPLAEADVSRAHGHSIVASNDPHGDSRLSTSHGVVPEGQTLAGGKPGSDRPVGG